MPRGSLETEVKGWSERGTGKAHPPHVVLGRLLSTLCTDVKGYGFPADFSKRWCQAYSLWKPSQDQLLHYESLLPWRITCPGLSIRHPAATRRGSFGMKPSVISDKTTRCCKDCCSQPDRGLRVWRKVCSSGPGIICLVKDVKSSGRRGIVQGLRGLRHLLLP
ncbi:uncharacterized protein LOC112532107 isoform X1 [Gallus gallus]|uniref:uncharacterized protein LOC112532107 isoform X1 n=1 Tax=Gallus gallus TaxID=9031 RepID=UPI001AE71530|nr:uncharacterized protein LOC112532107 isoform X1 [Gallus gallus]